MTDFIPGQRWISVADLQLGLGTVKRVDFRTVTLLFLATGDIRTYAKQNAPLTRVTFAPGDSIRSLDGLQITVESVHEQDGLLTYLGNTDAGQSVSLAEGELDCQLKLNRPAERLFTSQVDHPKWFELRYRTLQQQNQLAHSELTGLTGCRTSLIPHQLYIAHEVASRYAPRVLLADEVGLGKTIEAGLILHQQLLTGRAQRVLIIVPESLIHQWLVEMLRRFNLHFSIFDEERCQSLQDSGEANPFFSEQLVLCSLEFITTHAERFKQALTGDWDLLVVDEAHHLQWSPDGASLEYELIELLAAETRGVLLLTATPEQLGKASHFARLRLLDPDRFPDFEQFLAEEQAYEPIANAVEDLFNDQPLSDADHTLLRQTLAEGDNQRYLDVLGNNAASADDRTTARQRLIEHLLDRHGTGRVLFRNTRAAVHGFPPRHLHSHPLPEPDAYQSLSCADPHVLLAPELLYQQTTGQTDWTQFDPRVDWLIQQLKALKPHKVLVIAANATTAMDIAEALRVQAGIHAALFHEQLSIVERDRAAAFFADQDYGTQVMICSEIGSEGRNFQFAHHLVLFDLPLNPDLLEQRIGRLDRIGQTDTVQIHVPYLQGGAQETMLHWYHQGLQAFEHTCPAGHTVFSEVQDRLIDALCSPGSESDLQALLTDTRQRHEQLNDALARGRDRLLEYNSCRPHIAEQLQQKATQADAESGLWDYLENLFDCYGVDSEPHSQHSHIIRPGEHMHGHGLPGLQEGGMTVTCERDTALANEDMHFLTWEHPLVTGAMDMVTTHEQGNSTLVTIKVANIKPGSLLLECLYVLESSASSNLQANRYLPPAVIRILVDQKGNDFARALPHDAISRARQKVNRETANKVIQGYSDELRGMIGHCDTHAQQQASALLSEAHKKSSQLLQQEIHRLRALSRINANVRDEEIAYFENRLAELDQAIDAATPRLDAIRVIVTT